MGNTFCDRSKLLEILIFNVVISIMKSKFLYFFLIFTITVQLSFCQKSERIGIIDMEYILSKMEDYTKASEQLEEKIEEWKKEIDLKLNFINNLKDSLEIERPLLTKDLIDDRESEIDFEKKQMNDYKKKTVWSQRRLGGSRTFIN